MVTYRRGGHVHGEREGVERRCEHCDRYFAADGYPELISAYQSHLRSDHPAAWLRV